MKAYFGFEIHVELKTKSKMFCPCPIPEYKVSLEKPNAFICPICTGHPGTLPSLNRKALESGLRVALACKSQIAPSLFFSRKNYFYPDLPKNYQISQQQTLLGVEGEVHFTYNNSLKLVKIKDIHLEEDTAKLLYPEGKLRGASSVLVDFNRSGVPLLEIVTHPFLATPDEGRVFLEELQRIIKFLGVSKANMEEGAFRIDTNVSLPDEFNRPGVKTEIKNLNSFKSVEKALLYEIDRQTKTLKQGGVLRQETRGFNEKDGITYVQRRKETASDYRYYPDPDLPALPLVDEFLESLKLTLGDLPERIREKLREQGIRSDIAFTLTKDPETYAYFHTLSSVLEDPQEAYSWLLTEVISLLKEGKTYEDLPFSAEELGKIILSVKSGQFTRAQIKETIKQSVETNEPLNSILSKLPTSLSDEREITMLMERVLEEEKKVVKEFLGGKKQAFNFLLGKIMKLSGGRINPEVSRKILERKLNELKKG